MLRWSGILAAAGFALMASVCATAMLATWLPPVLALWFSYDWAVPLGTCIAVGVSVYLGFVTFRDILHRFPKFIPRLGHCPVCDYNLSGNTSGVCPECGTPTAHARRERSRRRDGS